MAATSPKEVTQLLVEWGHGDKAALDQLIPLVYDELRRLARGYMRREKQGHTLQTSALIHEAYLRLVDQKNVQWHNRAHFFGVAAQGWVALAANIFHNARDGAFGAGREEQAAIGKLGDFTRNRATSDYAHASHYITTLFSGYSTMP